MATVITLLAAGCGSTAADDTGSTVGPTVASTTTISGQPTSSEATSSEATSNQAISLSPWPSDPRTPDGVAAWSVEIVDAIPHDPTAYTQGLELADGVLYESDGLYGESSIRTVDPATGSVIARVALDRSVFGEGLTVVGEELVQITWREGRAFRWDRRSLAPVGEWGYEGEGWGICLMGSRLVMSNGSDRLTWRDPTDFSVISTVPVTLAGQPVSRLNELECIGGLVVANIYTTTDLVVINPVNGDILAVIDASPLLDRVAAGIGTNRGNVLNGIADRRDGTLLLGGKRWPEMFTVRIVAS